MDMQTLLTMNEVVLAIEHQGRYEEAEAMNRPTLALREKVLGVIIQTR
jgi:hypothetical protein